MCTHRLSMTAALAGAIVLAALAPARADLMYWIDGVPEYRWHHGCSPTAGAHLVGYWDRQPGYENLYEGTAPLNDPDRSTSWYDDVIASPEHYNSTYDGDQCTHSDAPNSLACFMHTDLEGSSYTWNVGSGMGAYAAWDDPLTANDETAHFTSLFYRAPMANWDQVWRDAAFGFSDLRREIDGGNPLLLNMSLDGGGHTVAAYGYRIDDSGNPWFAVRDTWLDGNSNGYYGISAEVLDGQEWWRFSLHDSTDNFGQAYYLDSAVPFVPNLDGPVYEDTDFSNDLAGALTVDASAETIYASLADGDEDWYRVWLTEGDRITLMTQDDEGLDGALDTYLTLTDAYGNTVTYNENLSSLTNTSNLFWQAAQSGDYYFGVKAGSTAGAPKTGDYALALYRTKAPEPGTILLLTVGLAGLVARRHSRSNT